MLICLAILSFGDFVQPAYAVPVTLTLDNPHQTIARPASGEIVLNFTGTVSFDHDFHFEEAELDFDYNSSSTDGIPTEFGPVDFSDANNGSSVTGVLFSAEILLRQLQTCTSLNLERKSRLRYLLRALMVRGL